MRNSLLAAALILATGLSACTPSGGGAPSDAGGDAATLDGAGQDARLPAPPDARAADVPGALPPDSSGDAADAAEDSSEADIPDTPEADIPDTPAADIPDTPAVDVPGLAEDTAPDDARDAPEDLVVPPPPGEAPPAFVALPTLIEVAPGERRVVEILATDPDDDDVSFGARGQSRAAWLRAGGTTPGRAELVLEPEFYDIGDRTIVLTVSDGDATVEGELTVRVTDRAFEVVAVEPTMGAEDVPADAELRLEFTKPVASFNVRTHSRLQPTVKLVSHDEVAGPESRSTAARFDPADPTGRTLLLRPVVPLRLGHARYSLVVERDVGPAAGAFEGLAERFEAPFRTARGDPRIVAVSPPVRARRAGGNVQFCVTTRDTSFPGDGFDVDLEVQGGADDLQLSVLTPLQLCATFATDAGGTRTLTVRHRGIDLSAELVVLPPRDEGEPVFDLEVLHDLPHAVATSVLPITGRVEGAPGARVNVRNATYGAGVFVTADATGAFSTPMWMAQGANTITFDATWGDQDGEATATVTSSAPTPLLKLERVGAAGERLDLGAPDRAVFLDPAGGLGPPDSPFAFQVVLEGSFSSDVVEGVLAGFGVEDRFDVLRGRPLALARLPGAERYASRPLFVVGRAEAARAAAEGGDVSHLFGAPLAAEFPDDPLTRDLDPPTPDVTDQPPFTQGKFEAVATTGGMPIRVQVPVRTPGWQLEDTSFGFATFVPADRGVVGSTAPVLRALYPFTGAERVVGSAREPRDVTDEFLPAGDLASGAPTELHAGLLELCVEGVEPATCTRTLLYEPDDPETDAREDLVVTERPLAVVEHIEESGGAELIEGELVMRFDFDLQDPEVSGIFRREGLVPVEALPGSGLYTLVSDPLLTPAEQAARAADLADRLGSLVTYVLPNLVHRPDTVAPQALPPGVVIALQPDDTLLFNEAEAYVHNFLVETFAAHALARKVLGVGPGNRQGTSEVIVIDTGFPGQTDAAFGDDLSADFALSGRILPGISVTGWLGAWDILFNPASTTGLPLSELLDDEGSDHGAACLHLVAGSGALHLGTCPDCRVLPVKAQRSSGGTIPGSRVDLAYELALSQARGDVISASLGLSEEISASFQASIDAVWAARRLRAAQRGKIIVKSAGNDNLDSAGRIGDAAASAHAPLTRARRFDEATTVVVGGSRVRGRPTSDAADIGTYNYGPVLALVAPAGSLMIYRSLGNHRRAASGTSFAAPQVAGALAVLIELQRNLAPLGGLDTSTERNVLLTEILEVTAEHFTGAARSRQGAGRLRLWRAALTLLNGGKPAHPTPRFLLVRSAHLGPIATDAETTWYGFRVRHTTRGFLLALDGVPLTDATAPPPVTDATGQLRAWARAENQEVVPVIGAPAPSLRRWMALFSVERRRDGAGPRTPNVLEGFDFLELSDPAQPGDPPFLKVPLAALLAHRDAVSAGAAPLALIDGEDGAGAAVRLAVTFSDYVFEVEVAP